MIVNKNALHHIIRPDWPPESVFLDWYMKTAIRLTGVIFEGLGLPSNHGTQRMASRHVRDLSAIA
jgi:hypothetical protein